MDYIGKRVIHKKFGQGKVKDFKDDNTTIVISFDTGEEKQFSFPMCFKSFLTLVDGEVAADAESLVQAKEMEEAHIVQERRARVEQQHIETVKSKSVSKKKALVSVSPASSVSEYIDRYTALLGREVAFLKNNGEKHHKLFEGKLISSGENRFVYVFEAEDEIHAPDGTQITLWASDAQQIGIIEGCDELSVTISTVAYLGREVPSIEYTLESWRLTGTLIDRIIELEDKHSDILDSLVCDGLKEITNSPIEHGQDNAVFMSTHQKITFIWGPPGTGKTETLAKIALQHIEAGNKVLMLSYSNVSVDGAILRLYMKDKALTKGTCVRYGYPRQKELCENNDLISYEVAALQNPDLKLQIQELLKLQSSVDKASKQYLDNKKKLNELRLELKDKEKEVIINARFVATTVSKAIVDKTIYDKTFDVVIFDEVSMAYIPQIMFAASLAKKHLVCMGDFKQLPPIVQSGATSELNADIFDYTGITHAVETGRGHNWLCMLDVQYRMHPDISDVASKFMYHGLLKSYSEMEDRRRYVVDQEPFTGYALGFADLSGMMSVCLKTADNSRFNPLSALISFSLALKAAANSEVGIITPYHAESKLLYAMARDAEVSEKINHSITCATVHQFQGSEKDVIIYDAVDCYRMTHPGSLLTSTTGDVANRLFNVALTRARGKFIGVANISYMEKKNLSSSLLFRHVIDKLKYTDRCMSASRLTSDRQEKLPLISFLNSVDSLWELISDIRNAKKEIVIDVPGKTKNPERTEKIASEIMIVSNKGVKVTVRAENKSDLPGCLKQFAVQNPYVANPIIIIDKRVVWFGEPLSLDEFVAEEKPLGINCRPIIRYEGKFAATSLYSMLEMNNKMDRGTTAEVDESGNLYKDDLANYILSHVKCKACKKPMKLAKSKSGKFFLSCTNYPKCNEMEFVDSAIVDGYIYRHDNTAQACKKCRCSLEVKVGKYGMYVQCCNEIARHRYKLDEI